MSAPLRIAMWCCPRTCSTALMRAFENRGDTFVVDEPLYASFLALTGRDHPLREEVLASGETDWRKVAAWLTGPVPEGKPVFYQKHMAHHLLPEMGREWMDALTHAFLIREPRELLPSLDAKLDDVELADTGYPQQEEIFERVAERTGVAPTVIDSTELLRDPPGVLRALCEALGLEFTASMLSWPPGPRASDGVWARHWYGNVEASTGFGEHRPKEAALPPHLEELEAACRAPYARLRAHALESIS